MCQRQDWKMSILLGGVLMILVSGYLIVRSMLFISLQIVVF